MQRIFMYGCALLVGASLAASSSPAVAAVIFSDDFNKADQALLGTTPVVGGAWTITGTSVVNPLNITSNAVPMTATGQDAFSLFSTAVPNVAANVITTSLDINLQTAGTGDYFAHLGDGGTSNFYQRLFAQASGAGYVLGILETSGGTPTPAYGTTVLPFGQSQHVDITWTMIPGATNDQFAVLVNSLPYVTKTWVSPTAEPTLVSSANLRQGTTGSAPTITGLDNYSVDALVIVPEPACVALMLICGVMGLVVRRNR
jgi:hypothetical protein